MAKAPQNIPDLGMDDEIVDTSIGMPGTVQIILAENDEIPPTGQFFGINGMGYMLRPGENANVPQGIVDILNHAITASALQDPTSLRIIRMRNRLRFPYRIVRPGDPDYKQAA